MEHYYLGIDVSKGYADFALLDSAKNPVMHNFQLDDTFQGHCILYSILDDFLQQCPEAVVYAAAESTGGYENNWLNSLFSFQAGLNISCTRLNPCGVYNNSRASLNRLTTDAISAWEVAEYMIVHPEKVGFDQQDHFATLRRQYSFITTLTKQKTQLLNQLESVLYASYPELLPYCQNSMPKWVLSLLQHYPTAEDVSQANPASLAKIPYITKKRAKELIQDAQKSVASATDGISTQLIRDLASQIRQMQKSINTQIQILTKNCPLQEVELLKSFPGIGDTTAVGLILYIQSIKRFPSVKQFCSLIRKNQPLFMVIRKLTILIVAISHLMVRLQSPGSKIKKGGNRASPKVHNALKSGVISPVSLRQYNNKALLKEQEIFWDIT